jgi:hypothetical protein
MNTRGARFIVDRRFLDLAAGTGMPPQLVRYWVAGAGAAKIGWGHDHDFYRCIAAIQQEVSEDGKPLSPRVIKGLCATLHKLATGFPPGHAPGESGHKH